MLNQKEIISLATGERVTLYLLISKIEKRKTKTGSDFLNLEFRDQTSTIVGRYWQGFESFLDSVKEGSIAKVAGKVDEYNGIKQIIIDKARVVEDEDKVGIDDFLPRSERELPIMIDELNEKISSIQNPFLKKLIDKMLSGNSYEKYIRVPAGKAWHHSYISGLLEHTIEIIKICELMCEFHSELNRDLLITGAILHDFGKVEELSIESGFDYTDKGRLMGHIVICSNMINEAASTIPDFPAELLNLVQHLVLSHQGKLEQASPVLPKTLEAIALYHADELSAKTNAYKQAVKTAVQENEDARWTKFLQLVGTPLFIPQNNDDEEEVKETLF